MATVCSGSLALMEAGVPITKSVAGIAMGLIKEDKQVAILSDILGDEDFLGDMDFKVAGTRDGITACQMDIKIDEGLSTSFLKKALEQALKGRLHILDIMDECIDAPAPELSPYAPVITTIQIPPDTIGAVIGKGGETIREITAETGTIIEIEDDGTVSIAATAKEASEKAIKWILSLTAKPEKGTTYMGVVKEVRDGLGCLVEFMPKTVGLLHISQFSSGNERLESLDGIVQKGDKIEVYLQDMTSDGKFKLVRPGNASTNNNHTNNRSKARPNPRNNYNKKNSKY